MSVWLGLVNLQMKNGMCIFPVSLGVLGDTLECLPSYLVDLVILLCFGGAKCPWKERCPELFKSCTDSLVSSGFVHSDVGP